MRPTQSVLGFPAVTILVCIIAGCAQKAGVTDEGSQEDDNDTGGLGDGGDGGDGGELLGGAGGTEAPVGGNTVGAGGSLGSAGEGGSGPIAGSGGAGGIMPNPMSCKGDALYCNDFENGKQGTANLLPLSPGINRGDALKIDDAKAYSGKTSVRIDAKSAGSTHLTMSLRDVLTSPKKIAYARMMLWLENTPGNSGHWDVIALSGPAEGGGKTWVPRFSFGGFGDNQMKLLYYANAPNGGLADCSKGGAPAIPLKQWVCVEIGVDETSSSGAYIVKVDGKPVGGTPFRDTTANSNCCCGSNNDNTWYVPDVISVKFGWAQVHEQLKPVTLWIDDVAVGEKPIGCPNQ